MTFHKIIYLVANFVRVRTYRLVKNRKFISKFLRHYPWTHFTPLKIAKFASKVTVHYGLWTICTRLRALKDKRRKIPSCILITYTKIFQLNFYTRWMYYWEQNTLGDEEPIARALCVTCNTVSCTVYEQNV